DATGVVCCAVRAALPGGRPARSGAGATLGYGLARCSGGLARRSDGWAAGGDRWPVLRGTRGVPVFGRRRGAGGAVPGLPAASAGKRGEQVALARARRRGGARPGGAGQIRSVRHGARGTGAPGGHARRNPRPGERPGRLALRRRRVALATSQSVSDTWRLTSV